MQQVGLYYFKHNMYQGLTWNIHGGIKAGSYLEETAVFCSVHTATNERCTGVMSPGPQWEEALSRKLRPRPHPDPSQQNVAAGGEL